MLSLAFTTSSIDCDAVVERRCWDEDDPHNLFNRVQGLTYELMHSKFSCHLPWDKLSQRSVEFVDILIGSKSIGAGMRRPNSSVWKDNQDLLHTASYYLLVRSRTLVSIGMRSMILHRSKASLFV